MNNLRFIRKEINLVSLEIMKHLLLIAVLLGLLSCSKSNFQKVHREMLSDSKMMELQGGVKELIESHYKSSIVEKSQVTAHFKSTFYLFNKNGFLLQKKIYDADSIQITNVEYKYNDRGDLIEQIDRFEDGSGTKTQMQYNEDHFITQKKVFNLEDKLLEEETNSYNEYNQLV